MLKDIVKYHEMWETKKEKSGKNSFAEEKRAMVLEFLFRVQQGEGIGLNDQGTFEEVFNAEMKTFEKRGRKRDRSESEEDSSGKKIRKELLSNELVNEQTSNEQVNEEESLPNSLEAEDYILENSVDKVNSEDNKKTETINLLRGYWHLKNEWKKLSDKEQSVYDGAIDVETCIQECHEILMHDLLDENKTPPGKFSVLPRSTSFAGQEFHYPSYATEGIAFQAVDTLVMEYNKMLVEISRNENKHEKLECFLKCATVMLFGFLTLHPFSDGNGRLARLLCSNCLKLFCPFPTAIYDVFSPSNREDYLTALVNAAQGLEIGSDQIKYEEDAIKEAELILEQKPKELSSLIIESNWFTWRQFLHRIGVDIKLFEFEKKTQEISAS
ncbi:unnamed protein product [Mytilus coruscus]|uniref:Fido domain-containing protein n=1 Tax=Mytilus coruscus TaxID=42192 RepID=A0A6J8CVX0_MYTCO|nr:unnamed protein product [Mytilus coruscus]